MTGRAGTAKGVAVGLKNFVKGRESEGGEGAGFFYWAHVGIFFAFFSNPFLTSFWTRFFFDFGKFRKPNCVPKSVFGKIFGMLFGHFHFEAIVWRFLRYFLKANLQNSCAHAMFCWSWQFLKWSQNASKFDPKINGFWQRKSKKNNKTTSQTWIFHKFWMDFAKSSENLGKVLGNILSSKKGHKSAKSYFSVKMWFSMAFGRVWGRSWEGLGKVLGRFWKGLGTFWVL